MTTLTTPAEYIDLIDHHFIEAKRDRISRLDPAWGTWSRAMNLELRARIELVCPNCDGKRLLPSTNGGVICHICMGQGGDPDATALKYVFVYWILRSQILEIYHKSRLAGMGRRLRLEVEASDIRKIVISGRVDAIGPVGRASFAELAGKIVVKPK